MAEQTHQTANAPATPPETTIIVPRAQEQTPPTDTTEKAALEAKERMSKTQGFWNRLNPAKEEKAKPAPAPAEVQPEKPKKEEKAEKPEKREPEKATEKVEGEPTKAETKPTKRKKEQEIDPIELARETGREIGREMAKAQNVPRGTTPEPAELELPDEFKPDVQVFEEMARLDPKRYANIKKDLAQYAAKEGEYIAKWEKEHEGETYDGDADEHDAFYAKIRPNYEQKDFKLAEKSLLKQEVLKEASQELRTREVEMERRRERAAQIQPEVDRDMFGTVAEMIREVDPENAELAKDWASIQTLDQKNPLLSDVIVQVHNETKPIVATARRLFQFIDQFDPNNPVHQQVSHLVAKAEANVSRIPIKDRYDDDGRLFATQEEYTKMSPADKARHWYIGEPEIVALIKGEAIKRTKEIYDLEKQRVERYTKRSNAAQTTKEVPLPKPEPPAQPKADNGSPTVGGRGTLPGDGQPAASGPKTGRDLFYSKLFGS